MKQEVVFNCSATFSYGNKITIILNAQRI